MSTWGQIRLLLSKSSPGVDQELIDGYLNSRYEQILEAADWEGIKEEATVETTAAYQSTTDTANFTAGSTAFTLSGAVFQPAWVGMKLFVPGQTVNYTIVDTLQLDRPYELPSSSATATGQKYTIFQDVYDLPDDCRTVVKDSVMNPQTGFPMTQLSRRQLDRSAGIPVTIGYPEIFAVHGDSPETDTPILHQIQFYPPPQSAWGIAIEIVRSGAGFDGTNTGDGPLPWISDTALKEGVEADICAYLAKQEPEKAAAYLMVAKAHEAKYQEEKLTLLRVEFQQRRPQASLMMATRFTRHRLERAARGLRTEWRGGTPGGPD